MGQPDEVPEFTRRQVAELIRAAARAGFAVGASGLWSAPPEPVIVWHGRVPQIVGWREGVSGDGGT